MNILIMGNSENAHAAHLKQTPMQASVMVDDLDTRLFPTQLYQVRLHRPPSRWGWFKEIRNFHRNRVCWH